MFLNRGGNMQLWKRDSVTFPELKRQLTFSSHLSHQISDGYFLELQHPEAESTLLLK